VSNNTLSDAHAAYLDGQAISPDVARAAGVRSAYLASDLPPYLVHHYSSRGAMVVPGIVFPWYPPDGSEPVWELRPDFPPEGCPKYLWSAQPVAMSVLPCMRERVADPALPLVYAEGTKQVLAMVSAIGELPYAVVGLHGCWGWSQDKMPSPGLGLIPHDGREVIIAMDGDRPGKRNVWDGAEGLAAGVRALGARTVRYLSLPVRGTNGADDYLATVPAGDRAAVLIRLIGQAPDRPGRRPPPEKVAPVAPENNGGYRDTLPDLGGSLGSPGSPYPGPPLNVDGAALLDEAVRALGRYVVFRDVEHAAAAALYVAATHAVRELQFAPRFRVKSPVKRCGKTLLLDVMSCMVHRALPTANVSAAALVRSIGSDPATLVLDEMDAVFGKNVKGDEKAETLRGVLNAGFGRGKPYIRYDAVNCQVESFPTFAMAIIAGIGDLPDTIEDRAIIVSLVRKTKDRKVARFRLRQHTPGLRDLGDRLAAWVGPLAAQIGDAQPAMPPGMSDRAEDTWEPLIAVADAAGGHWPRTARHVARVMSAEAAKADTDQDTGTRLLTDMREVFGDADRLPTTVILVKLAGLTGAPWGDWNHGRAMTDRQLADKLRGFGITPQQVKIEQKNLKGYFRGDFYAAWAAYVTEPPAPPEPPVQSDQPNTPDPPAPPFTPAPSPGEYAYSQPGPGVGATGATGATSQVRQGMPVAPAETGGYRGYQDQPDGYALPDCQICRDMGQPCAVHRIPARHD
jgi:hypothetical protein